jgi:transposase
MRKSFYTLSGIVTNNMGRNIQDGEVFIFINRTCTKMKILHMETGGLVIYHLSLDSGTLRLPVTAENSKSHPTTWHSLMLMFRSIEPENSIPWEKAVKEDKKV